MKESGPIEILPPEAPFHTMDQGPELQDVDMLFVFEAVSETDMPQPL